jgi:hypothetical protein
MLSRDEPLPRSAPSLWPPPTMAPWRQAVPDNAPPFMALSSRPIGSRSPMCCSIPLIPSGLASGCGHALFEVVPWVPEAVPVQVGHPDELVSVFAPVVFLACLSLLPRGHPDDWGNVGESRPSGLLICLSRVPKSLYL